MTEPALDLDASVGRADPDRWLASRFVSDAQARADLIALYAFDIELARALSVASEPMMAEIRLTWWAEALDEIFEGRKVRAHPVAQALAEAVARRGLKRGPLDSLIDTRMQEAYRPPFADEGTLFVHIDGLSGALMQAAASLLSGQDVQLGAVQDAGRAWGLARAGRQIDPERMPASLTPERMRSMVRQSVRAGRKAMGQLPVAAFPAIAYTTFARPYSKGRDLTALEKQMRLVWATARGIL